MPTVISTATWPHFADIVDMTTMIIVGADKCTHHGRQ